MNFNKDFEELFASFNARSVKALIVSGYAFAFHAKPRYTKDLDIFIEVPPNRIDLITVIDGVSFDEAWAGRAAGRYGEQPVFYIGRAELIRNKRASGRPIDLGDLEALE